MRSCLVEGGALGDRYGQGAESLVFIFPAAVQSSHVEMADRDRPDTIMPFGNHDRMRDGEEEDARMDDIPAAVTQDIVSYVRLALGRHGVPGDIAIYRNELFLSTDPSQRGCSLFPWGNTWPLMDESARQRKATEIARTLAAGRAASHRPPKKRRPISINLPALTGVAIAVSLITYFVWEGGSEPKDARVTRRRTGEASSTGASAPTDSRTRAAIRCAKTKARVFQGGTVSVADAEGWQVEIALLRVGAQKRLDTDPKLYAFVESPGAPTGSPFIWPEEPGLAAVATSDSVVRVQRQVIKDGKNSAEGVTLSFGGSLVDPYFREADRGRYYHIAHNLSETLEATHAAIFARCEDDDSHALGGWFRGQDAGGAAASLLYFMGTYAKPLHLAERFYSRPEDQGMHRPFAWDNIITATRPIDRAALATLVGTEGGMATGKPGEAVVITYPFRDGNRASRTSRSLARVVSLAE
jgi:hypothetical protein